MKKKIILTILLVLVVSIFTLNTYAGLLDEIIDQGNNLNVDSGALGDNFSMWIKGDIANVVKAVGYLVFAGVTVILGAKYIWSSADGRSEVLETLPNFVVAVVFFYLASGIVTWMEGATTDISSAEGWDSIAGLIFGTICNVVHYVAFGGILYLGIRYMFASAEGKAQLKTNMGGLIIGLIFTFLASDVVKFIIAMGEEIL